MGGNLSHESLTQSCAGTASQQHVNILAWYQCCSRERTPSCLLLSQLDTVGQLSEILLSGALREVNENGLLLDGVFGFRTRHIATLQLVHFVEGVDRNLDDRPQTGANLLDVAKAFETE